MLLRSSQEAADVLFRTLLAARGNGKVESTAAHDGRCSNGSSKVSSKVSNVVRDARGRDSSESEDSLGERGDAYGSIRQHTSPHAPAYVSAGSSESEDSLGVLDDAYNIAQVPI
jgi:hypothetical protein